MFDETDIISRYSRADAVRDGTLIDVSATAVEAGIRFPVAITRTAWERCIAVPAGLEGQDESGRLWDVVWLLRFAIRQSDEGSEVRFRVHVQQDNRAGMPPAIPLRAVCGPGDRGEPVVTVMMPDED